MIRIFPFSKIPPQARNCVVAIGNFDGVHLGHQKILNYVVRAAQKNELPSVVLTFSPHPEKVLGKKKIAMIQTLEQRQREILDWGVDSLYIIAFDRNFCLLSGQQFAKKIVVAGLRAKEVVVGTNFRFGKNRMGNVLSLHRLGKLLGFRVHSIPPVRRKGRIVSSSLIRNLLEEGKIPEANALLGRYYEIEGEVVKGIQRGKALGFPTANIQTENEILPRGVFLTEVEAREEKYPSLTNIGKRPTFHHNELNVESYLIDFSSDIYGERVKIKFLKKIRDEIRFASPEALRRQIASDLETARKSFKKLHPQGLNPA